MDVLYLVLVVIGPGVVTYALCRALRLPRRQTFVCVCVAVAGTVAAAAGLVVVSFDECSENRNPPRPLSWPWSPRREFCQPGSPAARGALVLLVFPTVVACVSAVLFRARRRLAAGCVLALVAVTPFLAALYVSQLRYYRLDSYPILHNPYVRPASDESPARTCYAYGIVSGPKAKKISNDSERTCVDLDRTADADKLVPEYASLPWYAETLFNLEWLGKRLTESGMKPGTSYRGLVATRVYTLPGVEARAGAFFVDTCGGCPRP